MAEQTKKVSLKWLIVLFPEHNEYSVVPTNWVTKNELTQVNYCYWPPGTVNSDVIQKADEPGLTWKMYRVKIYGGNKTFDNFNKAWHQQVIIEDSSNETGNEENMILRHKQKGKLMSQNVLFNVTDESDNDNDNSYNIMAQSSSATLNIVKPLFVKSNSNALIVSSLETDNRMSYLLNQSTSSATDTSVEPIASCSSLTEKDNYQQLSELMPPEPKHICSTTDFSLQSSNTMNTLNQSVLQQKNYDPTMNMMLNRILLKVENIEKILSKHKNENKNALLDNSFLSKFPIDNVEGFLLIETCISNEIDFVSKLEYFIRSIGGRDGKEHIRRSLTKLFTNSYAGKCTWTGRGKNIITKVGDSELIRIFTIIKDNAKKPMTNSDVEIEIAEWLRRANTRVQRDKLNE
ncbi:uncharacterized protein LOC126903777 isoform X2 [Daktulosphaira vitifoliae]|uniref:uncharacterized protein LOC126903777 isoform X2 n=1 Tax=Daktulosphaira vitifoliae TaxID=58002 RepID=UPI0021A9F8D2|nr:uncharacterized protein LOC126903777 isoform X2 [Daktulosphaira vitifoliae]